MELEELLSVERAGWEALSRGGGATFYGDLMHPDGVMVLPHGFVFDRDAVVESLDGAPPWRSYAIEQPRRVVLDAENVALVYVATASRGEGDPFHALMSSVYTRHDGQWRLVLHQQTPRPGAGG